MAATILGISAGTRTLGIALMRNGDLIRAGVKHFKGKWSREKMHLILSTLGNLIEHYQVKRLAVKAPDPLHSSPNVSALSSHILLVARKRKIVVAEYSLEDLKSYCRVHRRSKNALMDTIVEKHPELRREYLKECNSRTPYYMKMFEAIAAAELLAEEIAHV